MHESDYIYLDNNASTRIDPRVVQCMQAAYSQRSVNAASQHALGRAARQILEKARDEIAHCVGARTTGMEADRVVLTSGGTESNNLAILGLSGARPGSIVLSAIEHPSILSLVDVLRSRGRDVRLLPVNDQGVIRTEILREWLEAHRRSQEPSQRVAMVSIMLANNETGVIQPVQEVAQWCREFDVICHTDAVQAIGKMATSFQCLGVDAMTFTAHKLHGPVGIGGLIVRNPIPLEPQIWGGFQQLGLRPGTESVGLAVGFAEALRLAMMELDSSRERMQSLRQQLEHQLVARIATVKILGDQSNRMPHTSSVVFPGIDRQAMQMALDFAGLACGTGSACASGSNQPSHVLQAMGLPIEWVQSSVRFSLSRETTQDEVQRAVAAIASVHHRLAGS